MKRELSCFLRDESGQGLIEYGLLAAFISALAAVTIVSDPLHVSHALEHVFKDVRKALEKVGK